MVDGSPELCYGCNTLFTDRPNVYVRPAVNNAPERVDNFVAASSSAVAPDQTRYNPSNIFSLFFDTFLFPLSMFYDMGLAIYSSCADKMERFGGMQVFERSAASVVSATQNVDAGFSANEFATQFVRSMMRGR